MDSDEELSMQMKQQNKKTKQQRMSLHQNSEEWETTGFFNFSKINILARNFDIITESVIVLVDIIKKEILRP